MHKKQLYGRLAPSVTAQEPIEIGHPGSTEPFEQQRVKSTQSEQDPYGANADELGVHASPSVVERFVCVSWLAKTGDTNQHFFRRQTKGSPRRWKTSGMTRVQPEEARKTN